MNMQKETERTQKLNPLTILYIVVALAVISVIYDYKVSVVCVIVMMLVAAGFGEFTSYLKLWSRSILWMCALCFVLQIFFIPGEDVIWKYGVFQVTREGLEQASKLCSRLFGAGSAALAVVAGPRSAVSFPPPRSPQPVFFPLSPPLL